MAFRRDSGKMWGTKATRLPLSLRLLWGVVAGSSRRHATGMGASDGLQTAAKGYYPNSGESDGKEESKSNGHWAYALGLLVDGLYTGSGGLQRNGIMMMRPSRRELNHNHPAELEPHRP